MPGLISFTSVYFGRGRCTIDWYICRMFKKESLTVLKRRLSSLLLTFLAIMIFNSSIDSPDTKYTMVLKDGIYQEDLSKNDIETLFEFITELLLGHANAVKETDDQENDLIIKKTLLSLTAECSDILKTYPSEIKISFKPGELLKPSKILIDIPYPPPDNYCS